MTVVVIINNIILIKFWECLLRLPVSYLGSKIKVYSTIIISVILCGCEIWPLASREENK